MMNEGRGRPREHQMADHYTPQEAAAILGRSDETVRTWIKEGRLEGDEYKTPKNETRWRATKESVEAEAKRLGRPVTTAEMERAVQYETAASAQEILTEVDRLFKEHDERVKEAVGEIVAKESASIREAIEAQQADVSSQLGEIIKILRSVQEAERERHEQGQSERRSFWRRLFALGFGPI